MSKIVKKGIVYFFLAIVQKIQQGRIIPTVSGGIIGGAIGSLGWYLHTTLLPPCAFFGLLVGAALAAMIFPKGQQSPSADEAQPE